MSQPQPKKKKKGHAPAHQNKFAFTHNPNSRKTKCILSLPNVGVCRRCHDKLEWRKKYRKYKPRTQPGSCNKCHRKNVVAAYHTVCKDCAWKTEEGTRRRVCAICVKEHVLAKVAEEELDSDEERLLISKGKLTLRERKAIERRMLRKREVKKDDKDHVMEKLENDNGFDNDDMLVEECKERHDPLVEAVGGISKILVG